MYLKYLPDNFFFVGGSVRDFLLNRKINDYDFVVKTDENNFKDEVFTFLKKNFNKTGYLISKVFPPTIRLFLDSNEYVDVTLMIGDFKEDALRRDFTINAIYSDLKFEQIIDPIEGKLDINKKKIRIVSKNSFKDDPLRIIRAIRLLGQLPDFKITKKTYEQIIDEKQLLSEVSVERITHELHKIFVSEKRYILLKHLAKTGVLFEIIPELLLIKGLKQREVHKFDVLNHSFNILKYIDENFLNEDKIIYSYVALFHDIGKYENSHIHHKYSVNISKKILKKLKLPNRFCNKILNIIENHMRILQISLNNVKETTLKKLVFNHYDIIEYLINFAIMESYTKINDNDKILNICSKLRLYKKEFEKKRKFFEMVTGGDILAMGFKENRLIGEILNDIRFEIFKENLENRESILKKLNEIIKQKKIY